MPDILEKYALSNIQVGYIGAVQNVGSIAAMILGFILADRFPKLKMIILFFTIYAFVITGIGMLWFICSNTAFPMHWR